MDETYVDAKVTCTHCGSTFATRLDQDSDFWCTDCPEPHWHAAAFPCPVCGKGTRIKIRQEGAYNLLAKHSRSKNKPAASEESEPDSEEVAEEEPVTAESAAEENS
jgi:hypothetical protein